MKHTKLFFWIITVILLSGASVLADVKIKTRNTTAGQTTESIVYIKGRRQRSEQDFGGLKTVTLTQCDMRRDVQLNTQAKTYFVSLYETAATQTNENQIRNPKSEIRNPKGGIVTTIVTLRDTGERKQLFGYTARRILSTVATESSPDSCSPIKSQMETDGWYIDADFALDCLANRQYKAENSSQNAACEDRQVFRQVGTAKLGYPVYLKTTMRGAGDEDFVSIQEVLEISPATLDAALFEIPDGFREVKNRTEIFTGGMMNDADDEDAEEKPQTSTLGGMVKKSAPSITKTSTVSISEKKSGVVRLGVAPVKTGSVGEGLDASELAAAVKNTLDEYLKGTNVEIVAIEAGLPAQIKEEAKQKQIDFVLFLNVSHKKGGGGFGKMFGRIAPVIADSIPGAERSVEANTAINAGRDVLYTAGDAARSVKAKDELTLEINLETSENQVLAKQFKAKAKSDGEDLITPLVEQIAQAILQAVSKK